jgi:hypothetical protein
MSELLKKAGNWLGVWSWKIGVIIFSAGGFWVSFNNRIDAIETRSLKNEANVSRSLGVLCEMAIETVPDKENTKRYCKRN